MDINLSNVAASALPVNAEPARPNQPANRYLIQAVRTINGAGVLGENNELTFSLDRDTQRPVMKIVDRRTNEVVQQVPPKYVLQMARELRQGRA